MLDNVSDYLVFFFAKVLNLIFTRLGNNMLLLKLTRYKTLLSDKLRLSLWFLLVLKYFYTR